MPLAPGKIVCQKKGDTTYVYYEIDRTYDPEKKYTAPKRVTIGKCSKADLIEQSIGFLNEWNSTRDHRQKIYISYDSTNKNCQAGDIEIAEFGHAKDDKNLPIFNYSIAYDTTNRELAVRNAKLKRTSRR